MAGGAARTVAAIVTCPITVVKTQMEYAGHGVKHKVRMPNLQIEQVKDSLIPLASLL